MTFYDTKTFEINSLQRQLAEAKQDLKNAHAVIEDLRLEKCVCSYGDGTPLHVLGARLVISYLVANPALILGYDHQYGEQYTQSHHDYVVVNEVVKAMNHFMRPQGMHPTNFKITRLAVTSFAEKFHIEYDWTTPDGKRHYIAGIGEISFIDKLRFQQDLVDSQALAQRQIEIRPEHMAMFCDHANEVPQRCPCRPGCYCKTRTCRDGT